MDGVLTKAELDDLEIAFEEIWDDMKDCFEDEENEHIN